ncbi:MFS transporter [Acidianus manzaensis]|uniref:MFS transporter n=1 Tax=Acidianus manzaensis TaxID=282676 RepID=A0A1W6JXQ2_9CREN|nr:MFS transporter [Acidianus manzaensis]ARM75029.1 MFS transporter [Acidianus manzaensis]
MKGYSIIIARIIYSISWFYLAPAIPMLISKFQIPEYLSGFIPFSFFLGSGIMQLPSAFLSSKIGVKRALVLGLIIMSISSALVGISGNFYELLISYFIGGVGASMFFSTGAAILTLLNEKNVGKVLGIYNAAFSIGGIIGLNWIFLYDRIGFQLSTILLSIITLIVAFLNIDKPNYKPNWNFIKDKVSLFVGISTSGVWGIYYVIGELFPNFSKIYLHLQVIQGSEFTAVLLISAMIGGLLGFLSDRFDKIKLLVISSLLGIFPSLFLYTRYYLIGIIILGIFNELAISVTYTIVSSKKSINAGITLAEVNSINILLGSLFEPLSSLLGYNVWILESIISVFPLFLLAKIKLNA